MKLQSTLGALCALLALSGCQTARPPGTVEPNPPARWQAPLPGPAAHGGSAAELADWWRRLDDPLLVELIGAAQAASPDLAAAAARIEEARATRVAAGAALLPRLDGSAAASRSNSATFGGSAPAASGSGGGTGTAAASTGATAAGAAIPVTTAQLGVQAQWEIDLFGRLRANREAGDLRLAAAEARWHDARVAVAAETANAYFGERACRAQLAVSESDAGSRGETARLTDLSARAGFTAPADAALARAGAADASARLTQQRAQCELQRKGLVALTGLQEPDLRSRLESAAGARDLPAIRAVDELPAVVLAQRPDVFAAEQAVAAASADVGAARAERYPRLSLSGTVGRVQLRAAGFGQSLNTWTIGPVALTVPLFDGGTLAR